MLKQKQYLAARLKEALDAYAPQNDLAHSELYTMIEYPPDSAMGDLAFPCFGLSKRLRRGPQMIAAELAKSLADESAFSCEVVGGYLNFRLQKESFSQATLCEIEAQGAQYGADTVGCGKTVVLDYSSPNPFIVIP